MYTFTVSDSQEAPKDRAINTIIVKIISYLETLVMLIAYPTVRDIMGYHCQIPI